MHCSMAKPLWWNFRVITANFLCVWIFRIFYSNFHKAKKKLSCRFPACPCLKPSDSQKFSGEGVWTKISCLPGSPFEFPFSLCEIGQKIIFWPTDPRKFCLKWEKTSNLETVPAPFNWFCGVWKCWLWTWMYWKWNILTIKDQYFLGMYPFVCIIFPTLVGCKFLANGWASCVCLSQSCGILYLT